MSAEPSHTSDAAKTLLKKLDTVEIRREGGYLIIIPLNGGPSLSLSNEDIDSDIHQLLEQADALEPSPTTTPAKQDGCQPVGTEHPLTHSVASSDKDT